jgi:hypothetical protein
MTESNHLPPVVVPLLAELRERLNAMFRQHLATGAKIDGQSWLRHVEQYIAPVVAAVHAVAPDRSKETLVHLYEIGLELSALGHFNVVGGSPRIIRLWRDAFPAIASVLSLNPRWVIGSLSNAVLSLSQLSGAKADAWLAMLTELGPRCQSVDQLLNLGKFLGWTSGFAHMRRLAIPIAAHLPVDLLRRPLGMPGDAAEDSVRKLLIDLAGDPWADGRGNRGSLIVLEVLRCGNFRGLDGEFIDPPRSYLWDGGIHLTDGHRRWRLHADRFGYTLDRRGEDGAIPDPEKTDPSISADGQLRWGSSKTHRLDLARCTSQSFDGNTLAITIPTSYHVFLFARRSS